MTSVLWVTLILAAGFLVKIPAFTHPLVGHFASYQAFNAMMAEMMIRDSFQSLFMPQIFIIENGRPALHLLYYPFASLTAALFKFLFGGSLDFWGRFQASFYMLGACLAVFSLAKKCLNEKVAVAACFLMTFSPMALVSGISFQNEAAGVFFLTVSFLLALKLRARSVAMAGLLFSFALIARIHFIFILPALLAAIFRERHGLGRSFWFLLAAAVPVLAWYGWIYFLGEREAAHVYTSFFSQAGDGRILQGGVLFQGDFVKRILEIVVEHWLTPVLFAFLILGFFQKPGSHAPFVIWALGSMATIVFIPQKVSDHPFYLISGLPAVAILAASAWQNALSSHGRFVKAIFFAVFLFFSMRYYLPPAFSGGGDAVKIPGIGRYIQSITQAGDRVIMQHGTSADLLYYSGRLGWPFDLEMEKNIITDMPQELGFSVAEGYGKPVEWLEFLRSQGAKYFVISEPEKFEAQKEFSAYVRRNYVAFTAGEETFLVFDLEQPSV